MLSVLRTWQAEKSHGKPCAYRGKCKGADCAWRALTLYLAAAARVLTAAGAAAGHYAACEVVAGEDDLEVVGDKGAQIAVRIADLVLRLVRLHHGHVSIRAIRRCGRWAVLLPPRRGKLRFLLESGADGLLTLGVRIVNHMPVGTISLARAFVDTVNHALLGAQFTRNRLNISRESNLRHNAKDFNGWKCIGGKRGR